MLENFLLVCCGMGLTGMLTRLIFRYQTAVANIIRLRGVLIAGVKAIKNHKKAGHSKDDMNFDEDFKIKKRDDEAEIVTLQEEEEEQEAENLLTK